MVRALYAAFVKGLFSSAQPGCYQWRPDDSTGIFVSGEHPIRLDKVGVRPAVSFTRGPVSFYSLGMDDTLRHNLATGKKTKGVLVPGVMSINCCSRVDLESEFIAWVISEHLWLLREMLMKAGFFEIGRQPQIGAPSPAGSIVTGAGSDEWFCTTVQSPFQFPRMSQFTPLNQHIVNNIVQQINVNDQKFVGSCGPKQEGFELPVNVNMCPPPSFAPDSSDAQGGTPDPAGTGPAKPQLLRHPLNPAVRVVLKSVNPYKPGLAPPSMNGRRLPLAGPCVEES